MCHEPDISENPQWRNHLGKWGRTLKWRNSPKLCLFSWPNFISFIYMMEGLMPTNLSKINNSEGFPSSSFSSKCLSESTLLPRSRGKKRTLLARKWCFYFAQIPCENGRRETPENSFREVEEHDKQAVHMKLICRVITSGQEKHRCNGVQHNFRFQRHLRWCLHAFLSILGVACVVWNWWSHATVALPGECLGD